MLLFYIMTGLLFLVLSFRLLKDSDYIFFKKDYTIKKYYNNPYGECLIKNVLYDKLSNEKPTEKKS